jgi:guanine deaminase
VILGGCLILPGPGNTVVLRPGAVQIDGGHIARVFDAREAPKPDLGGDDCIISPGFVDAHLHLPQFDSIGLSGMTLLDWLSSAIFPAEAKWADEQYAAEMTRRVVRQLHSHGTTGVAAYATVHHEATVGAMRVLAEAGFEGIIGQVLMDREAPPELIRPARQLLAEAARLATVGRMRPAVTPRFALSCSGELLSGAGGLAAATGWPIQTHLAETWLECERVAELFDGATYTEVYRRAGLLTPRTILAHGIHLDATARVAIADAKAVVAHCPVAKG